jgi:HK97 family phage major capsid protein
MDKYQRQLDVAEREMRDLFGKAKEITTNAAEAGRPITDEEEVQLKSYLTQAEVLKEKRAEIQGAIETRQRVEDAGEALVVSPEQFKGEEIPAHLRASSLGDAFVKSEGYQNLLAKGLNGDWSTGLIDIETGLMGKTLLDLPAAGGTTGNVIAPQYEPGVLPKLFQRLTVSDLMPQGVASSGTVRYLVESVATNAAAATAEGATKPESTLDLDSVDESVKKIATFLPVTEEMLEDGPAIQSYINARLALFVQIAEEAALLYGTGAGANIKGIVPRIPANNLGMRKAGASVTDADHVFRAISRIRESFLEPDGIIMHPNDWEGIVLLKDTQNRYMGTGPWTASQPGSPTEPGATLWGLNVVVTQAVTEAQPILGAFKSAAQVYRRGGLTVEASNSHSTFFQENKVAIRAEERLALAVYRPEAFATADLGATGSAT